MFAMPIKFAVKIVQLKVYMTIASPMTLIFAQGHNFSLSVCQEGKENGRLATFDDITWKQPILSYLITFILGMTVDLCLAYIILLVSMTVTLKT